MFRTRGWLSNGTHPVACPTSTVTHLPAGGLEDLDRVAGGIVEQDLLASRPGNDVVAEAVHSFGSQALDLGLDVVNDVRAGRLGAPGPLGPFLSDEGQTCSERPS